MQVILLIFFFRFSTNSNILDVSPKVYTGSEDGTIKLWDLRLKNKCVNVYKGKNISNKIISIN